ncbi:hypothetical protein HMPREF0574_0947 [Mobiluncus curtisii subsp. curtisii ATCC 35241]|uniref:Uncharacterized protein n=2 Tax=Mobiluncus TaxID=2050 RepID=E6M514_9ACTO|nr:hypothetical protein HMPREF0574_0947 [Mobiluncus curtisii subsp. curtisii ATCC 35241]EFU81562.1 hypothetical protein HMPREF0576_1404 [Mobiluncus holmesii ATCC 35242]MCU9986498.1 GNAT family acetyltransferase [Mobiluncus curtisii]STY77817.1 Uncharacterised protein [Mobiluncus curtisii subsp. curtisii]STY89794.1 Uncharacterised protein [Mobiluncus holmesii]
MGFPVAFLDGRCVRCVRLDRAHQGGVGGCRVLSVLVGIRGVHQGAPRPSPNATRHVQDAERFFCEMRQVVYLARQNQLNKGA